MTPIASNSSCQNRRKATGLLFAICLAWALPAQTSVALDDPGLTIEGTIEVGLHRPVFVDQPRQLLYTMENRGGFLDLNEYDLTRPPGAGMLVRSRSFDEFNTPLASRNFFSFDAASRRLYALDAARWSGEASCLPNPPLCMDVRTIDLDTLQVTKDHWDLTAMLPGFRPLGLTYSESDRRLYLIGTPLSTWTDVLVWQAGPVLPAIVAAIDVDKQGIDALAWVRPIKTCTLPMTDFIDGAGIFRSERYDALYFACSRADTLFVGAQYPGHVGIVRLWIDPSGDRASGLSSERFREDFYRASGAFSLATGMVSETAFDPVTERMLMVSMSPTTPGVWVFDGQLSAWVGFVLSEGHNLGIGVDPMTGMVAVRDSTARFLFFDLLATPVTQGSRYAVPDLWQSDASLFDAQGRMYFWSKSHLVIARPPPLPPQSSREINWDSITMDVDEGPDTNVTFAGTSAGFGARVMMVGGVGGATSITRPALIQPFVDVLVGATPFISPGDRGIQLGQLSVLDLRDSGTQAAAQAVAPDDLTANDDRTVRRLDLHKEAARNARAAAEAAARSRNQDQDAAGDDAESALSPVAGVPDQARQPLASTSWPWEPVFCSDGGGARQETSSGFPQSADTSYASVACDLDANMAEATAHARAVNAGGVTIGDSGITSKSTRTSGQVLVQTHSWSRDVEISLEGAGVLRIGEVSLDVITKAGGRPGTTVVEHTRTIEGVEIRDTKGEIVFTCTSCDPHVVAAHVNETLGGDIRMTIPEPEIIKTPKGAFAGFREPFRRYVNDLVMNNDSSQALPSLQIEIYQDLSDKARTFVQLAAIDSSSLYGITRPPSPPIDPIDPGNDGGPIDPGTPIEIPPFDFHQPDTTTPPTYVQQPSGIGPKLARQALFLVRSPGEAVSMIFVLSLIVGFVALSIRRRALGGVL